MDRKSSAVWQGNLKEGKGTFRLGSGLLEAPYSFATRFGDAPGTNPEELVAAAHASCFSMAFSNGIAKAGLEPRRVETTATVHMELVGGGFQVARIDLQCTADVPQASADQLQTLGADAKANCPISRLLAAVPIGFTLNGNRVA